MLLTADSGKNIKLTLELLLLNCDLHFLFEYKEGTILHQK